MTPDHRGEGQTFVTQPERGPGVANGLTGEARTATGRSSWVGEDVSRKPRQLLRQREEDIETEWVAPSEHRQMQERRSEPVPPADVCPKCKTEVLYMMQSVPDAIDIQVPCFRTWRRRSHLYKMGTSARSPPHPVRRSLPVWLGRTEIDATATFLTGPASLPEPNPMAQERPFTTIVDFNLAAFGAGQAPWPHAPDAVGAIRKPRPAPKAGPMFLDPYPRSTKPG
jgi:hypothetical protein